MSEALREDVKAALRRHDHDADDLRELSEAFDALAEKYDNQDDIL